MTAKNLLSVLALCALTTTARAGISLVSGPGMLVVNPANQKYTANPYDIDTVFYWPERSSVTLSSDLVVSILPPSSFPTDTIHVDDNTLHIPSGTTVDSYYLHYDPSGNMTVAAFSFDNPILGLITNSRDSNPVDDHFLLSDFLITPAVPTANIPTTHFNARGIEPINGGDFIRWISPTQIELHIGASNPGDQIRVITNPAPEPATLALLVPAALLMRRRRTWHHPPGH